MSAASPAPRWRIVLAFAVVYIVWGSTYLAIRYAITTIPPLLMAGARFLSAGGVLYAWCRLRGAPRPPARDWAIAGAIGALLILCGNGGVSWAEQRLTSGSAALLVATEPLWLVGLAWAAGRTGRPTAAQTAGIIVGLCGVALLISPAGNSRAAPASVVSAGVALLAAFTWAAGSLYAATAPMMSRGPIATAMQMLMGGFSLIAAGMATGEAAAFQSAHVTLSSLLALGYLAAFGSLVAFSAYSWLLQRVSPARLSTYAYVNPIIAVLVGWLIGHEGIDARTVGATVVIVGGVVLLSMVTHGVRRRGTDTGRSA